MTDISIWWRPLPAAWLSAGVMLAAAPALLRLIERFVRSGQQQPLIDPVLQRPLHWLRPLHWTVAATLAAGAAAVLLSRRWPLLPAVGGAVLIGCLIVIAAAGVTRRMLRRRLELALLPAVGRLSALLSGGVGFRAALERTAEDLDSTMLAEEWHYLLNAAGRPLPRGGVVTVRQALTALAQQTLSTRHAVFLQHIAAALDQPHDVVARRCAAAYAAMQASERRRAEAQAELAQMRYSGLAIGFAGLLMAAYLALTQWPRMTAAYGTPDGRPVALLVAISLAAPMIGAYLLTEVGDVDY